MKVLVLEDLTHTLERTSLLLSEQYPDAEIRETRSLEEAIELAKAYPPDLLVVDLGIPKTLGEKSLFHNGIHFLTWCMGKYPNANIAVQTAAPRALVRIKKAIDTHQGGFTVIDKILSVDDMLRRITWATEGIIHIKDVRGLQTGVELKPEWLETLRLASREDSLQDKEIAHRLNVTEPTVRHYWKKIQDALEIYPDTYDERKNLRVYTVEFARDIGLID